ncbi:unnamed protein product [Boreogadus saida]
MNPVSLQKDHSKQSPYRLSGMVSPLGESIDTCHYVRDVAGEDGAGWFTLNDARVTSSVHQWSRRGRPCPTGSEPGAIRS